MDNAHYFTSEPAGEFVRKPLKVTLAGEERSLVTSSGIFNPDSVDKGTAILLREAPLPPAEGTFLDIGCGWGPITLTLALESPAARVVAVDVNQRSITLTQENAARVGADRVEVSLPEEVDPDLRFDLIWSNPPIRIGKEALHELLLLWLPRLSIGGEAWLVVQKNLGADSLQKWMSAQLGEDFTVTREATDKAFRIIKVARLR